MWLLDFAPFTASHAGLIVVAFLLVYGSIAWLLRHTAWLRPVSQSRIVFAGVVLVVTTALLAQVAVGGMLLGSGLLIAAVLTIIAGSVDERVQLSPLQQLTWQLIIIGTLVASGWRIVEVTNPFAEGVWTISSVVLSGALTALWLLLLVNAFNWLDGSDGLAPGVGVVALFALAAVALLPSIQDEQALSLALVGAGSVLGFLLWNFPPARVYLGTVGSWWLGLYIGIAAMSGGGKVVTTLLLLALPLIDAAMVTVQRVRAGQPVWRGDRERHLHFRLQVHGYSPRVIAVSAMACTAILGIAALTLQTTSKVAALIVATLVVIGAAAWLTRAERPGNS